METVFHASLAVEAHIVQHVLEQAGIPSRIDGEYLQGASGELPPGDLVRVRVAPEHAAEARSVIAEWEKSQPKDPLPTPKRTGSSWAPYTLVLGLAIGFTAAWIHYRTPYTTDGADFDGDGHFEERFFYAGGRLSRLENDLDSDGRADLVYEYDSHGRTSEALSDDDLDGRFETRSRYERGALAHSESDRDGDGFYEEVTRFNHGRAVEWDYLSPTTHAVLKRSHFQKNGVLTDWSEYDADGDGKFERTVKYDAMGDPLPAQ